MALAFFDALVAGLAALYVWVFLSQLHTPGFGRLQRWARRGWRVPLVGCPWCSGWWLGLVFTILLQLQRLDWIATPLTALAAAALCGFVGSLTPGMDEADEDDDDR